MGLRLILLWFALWFCIGVVVSILVHEFDIFDDN